MLNSGGFDDSKPGEILHICIPYLLFLADCGGQVENSLEMMVFRGLPREMWVTTQKRAMPMGAKKKNFLFYPIKKRRIL